MAGSDNIVWVHNFPTHYTEGLFEAVARRLHVEYLFFGRETERWFIEHGFERGEYVSSRLTGRKVLGVRFTPCLPVRLWAGGYAAFIKCINCKVDLVATFLISKARRKPFILYTGVWNAIETVPQRIAAPVINHICRQADAIVVYGEHVKRYLVRQGADPSRIFVEGHAVENAIYGRQVTELEKSTLRAELGISDTAKVVLYVGRIEACKGLDCLMSAFSQIVPSDSILILAGTGSQEGRLRDLARELKIHHRVRFAGYVPPLETIRYYGIAWAFVLPSITTRTFKEPWGLVVNEAFNQGVPVIASDAVGAAAGGFVEDGVNGFVVAERNANALATAIRRVLDDPALRNSMGAAGLAKVRAWNHDSAADAIERAVRFALGKEQSVRYPVVPAQSSGPT